MAPRLRLGTEVVPMVLVALLVCQLIRSHLLEWYRVPSSSMEPTLHGDPVEGDLVLVQKTAYWFRQPERFDLVVLRPGNPQEDHLVKRLVASGDDELSVVRVEDGDVFLGPTRQDLQRLVKDPARSRDLRLPHFVFPGSGEQRAVRYFRDNGAWSLSQEPESPALLLEAGAPTLVDLEALLTEPSASELDGHLSTREPVTVSFLDHAGGYIGDALACRDVGLELDVAVDAACTGLQVVIDLYGRHFAFHYAVDGSLRWTRPGNPRPAKMGRGAPLVPGETRTIACGYLDGSFFLEVDGQVVMHEACEVDAEAPGEDSPPANLVHLAAAGGGARIARLVVFHDVYYRELRAPFGQLPLTIALVPGELFLLGDNTFASQDSRTGRTFSRDHLIGRPLAVIGPSSRRRWLTR